MRAHSLHPPLSESAQAIKPIGKVAIVVGAYVAAAVVAVIGVALRVTLLHGPEVDAAGGMYAFGDVLLFLGVFGLAATAPTGLALYFLRPYPAFWNVVSRLSLATAVTGLLAVPVFALGRHAATSSMAPMVGMLLLLSLLRLLLSPLLCLLFLLGRQFSVFRVPRTTFSAAALMEAVVVACIGVVWFIPAFFNRH